MGYRDLQKAFKVDLPAVDGMTMLALRSVLNVVAAATDDKTHETFVSRATICNRSGAGQTTVKRALEVLVGLGVLSRETRYRENGSQSSSLIRFTPEGSVEAPRGSVEDQGGVRGGPPPRSVENPPGVRGGPPYIDQSEDQSLHQSSIAAFERFWEVWPRKRDRPRTFEAWKVATAETSPETILEAAHAYANNPGIPEDRFIPGSVTWLNRQGWLETLPAPSPAEQTPKRYQFTDEDDDYTRHEHEPNAVKALTKLIEDCGFQVSLDELLSDAYRIGNGDPWDGCRQIKFIASQGFEDVRDATAVLRKRLANTLPRTRLA